MKNTLLALFLLSNLTSCSQSYRFVGDYEAKYGSIQYLLTLNPDGTFLFRSYNDFKYGAPEPSISGKGTWQSEKNMISFATNPQKDLDHAHTLIFNNSKATFESKFPRNKDNEIIVTKLSFFESDIFWVKGIELKRRNI